MEEHEQRMQISANKDDMEQSNNQHDAQLTKLKDLVRSMDMDGLVLISRMTTAELSKKIAEIFEHEEASRQA